MKVIKSENRVELINCNIYFIFYLNMKVLIFNLY